MRNFFLTIFGLVPILLIAQTPEKIVQTRVDNVTVYPSGAQVERSGKLIVPRGDCYLRFTGLSSLIDKGSIQVKNVGQFEVISVNSSIDYMQPQVPAAEVDALQNNLDDIRADIANTRAMNGVYEKEEIMLMANQSIGTEQNGVSLIQLQQMADFFRNRLTDLKTRRREADKKLEQLTKEEEKIKAQLENIRSQGAVDQTTEIDVLVRSGIETSGKIILSYFTSGAGWRPLYDLRVEDVDHPVKLVRKAEVSQSTGEDWNNVKLTLSSSNPNLSGRRPELWPAYLNSRSFVKPAARQYIALNEADYKMARENTPSQQPANAVSRQTPSLQPAAAFISGLQRDFKIALPYSIRSDGKVYFVSMGETDMPGQFEFQTVPSKEAAAFVVARIPNWESYDLLSGTMNLFFEGTYIGQSWLDAEQTADTLELSMGRDPFILVERKRLKEFTSDQSFGSSRKSSRAYEISVRNTKPEAVLVRIEDQVPVSQVDDIEVKLTEQDGAIFDKENGRLIWIVAIEPSQTKKVIFRYEVKYPKSVGNLID